MIPSPTEEAPSKPSKRLRGGLLKCWSNSASQIHIIARTVCAGSCHAVYGVPSRSAVVIAQILIHLDGNTAVIIGLGGGDQVLVVLCIVVFLVEVQGQVGQLRLL